MRRLSSLLKRRDSQASETGRVSDTRSPTASVDPFSSTTSVSSRAIHNTDPYQAQSSSASGSRPRNESTGADALPATSPPPYQAMTVHEEPQSMSPTGSYRASIPSATRARLSSDVRDDQQVENPLRALARYDVVYLIDDSGSMRSLWQEARNALIGIVGKSILYDKDGIDIFFLNSERTLEGCTSTQAVERLFGDVRPRGSTPTAVRLDEILRPYLDKVEDAKTARSALPKPLVVIVITDGRADDPDTLKDVIIEMAGRLDVARLPPFQLGIQFLQIGSDPDATAFLRELDDDLKAEHSVRDMVDTVVYKGSLHADFIMQSLLGSINRRVDAQSH